MSITVGSNNRNTIIVSSPRPGIAVSPVSISDSYNLSLTNNTIELAGTVSNNRSSVEFIGTGAVNVSSNSTAIIIDANIAAGGEAYTVGTLANTTAGSNVRLSSASNSNTEVKFVGGGIVNIQSNSTTITVSAPAPTDNNTTYDLILAAANTTVANVQLVGSDATTDVIRVTGSGAVNVSSNTTHIVVSAPIVTDTDTTYTLGVLANTTAGSNVRLTSSGNVNTEVRFVGTGLVNVQSNTTAITISASAPAVNTYVLSTPANTTSANLTLTASGGAVNNVRISGAGSVTVSANSSNGITITGTDTDTNTTYDLTLGAANTTVANVQLVGSDATTDIVRITGNGAVNVSSNTTHIIVNAPVVVDTDTTYSQSVVANTLGANVRLTASTNANDDITFANGAGITITATNANTITIAATGGTDTTYTVSALATTGGANVRLTSSTNANDDVKFTGTGTVTVSTSGDTITIDGIDNSNTRVLKAGDIMTGNLTMILSPVQFYYQHDGSYPSVNALEVWDINDGPYKSMVIDEYGYIGIGTDNPVAPVHVRSSGDALIRLDTSGTTSKRHLEGTTNNSLRWQVVVGNIDVESGSNTGSNFEIARYSDGGARNVAFSINRATGVATFQNAISINTNISVGANVIANTTAMFVGNSTVNTIANSILVKVANSTATTNVSPIGVAVGTSIVNTTVIAAGANVIANTTAMFVGNSTVNAIQTQTSLLVSNSTNYTNTQAGVIVIGNTTVNVVANSTAIKISNSTVNTTFTLPNSVQYSATNAFLHANGQWVNVAAGGGSPGGANTQIQFNNSGTFSGSENFTFNSTLQTVTVNGSIAVISTTPDAVGISSIGITASNTIYNNQIGISRYVINNTANSASIGFELIGAPTFYTFTSSGNGFEMNPTRIRARSSVLEEATLSTNNLIFVDNYASVGISSTLRRDLLTLGNSSLNSALTTTSLTIGNNTSNLVSNSIVVRVANSTSSANLTAATLTIGNTTINVVANSTAIKISNSTVNTTFTLPNTAQYGATNAFLHANGQWVNVAAGGGGETYTISTLATSGGANVRLTASPSNANDDVKFTGTGSVTVTVSGDTITIDGAAGAAAAGGANTQVQFNNSTVLAGSDGFTFDTISNTVTVANTARVGNSTVYVQTTNGTVQLVSQGAVTPAAPLSNTLLLFARNAGGRQLPAFIGPSGVDTSLQPWLARNKIYTVTPVPNGTTFTLQGMTIANTLAYSARAPAATNTFLSLGRVAIASNTTAGTSAGQRGGQAQFWRGNAANLGGFTFVARFGISIVAADMRAFVGLKNSTTVFANGNPSAQTNIIGIGFDSTQTTWRIMTNAGSGTAPTIDLGSGFPTDVGNTNIYELAMFHAPNGSVLNYQVTNLTTSNTVYGSITANSTNMPSSTTFLTHHFWINNGATAAAAALDIVSLYIETDL